MTAEKTPDPFPCFQTWRCSRTTSSVSPSIGAAGHAAAFFENAELAGDPPRERQLLLDQQHRDARVPIEPQDDVADLVHDVRLNAFGRLVQDQQLRLEHERAADRELLLLSAGEIAAAPAEHLLQDRETGRRSAAESHALPSGARPRPTRRFSSTVSCGKISRPCGT